MKAFIILLFSVVQLYAQDNNFYTLQFSTPTGQIRSFGEFKGKKVMLVILPVNKTDSNLKILSSIDSFATAFQSRIAVVGIPTFEYGYNDDSLVALTDWYRKFGGKNLIVSKGLISGKTNKSQSQLFAWLTNASLNGHFDQEIDGPGEVFFIDESGQLYGIISATAFLNGKIFKKMAHIP